MQVNETVTRIYTFQQHEFAKLLGLQGTRVVSIRVLPENRNVEVLTAEGR